MKILLIGSGGREHALALKLKESSLVEQIYAVPGNPGILEIAEMADISITDFEAVAGFVNDRQIDLVIVGPEEPLINGITDFLQAEGIAVFGPTQKAALIEGSKAFSKDLMKKYHIPTAAYQTFTDYDQALSYLAKGSGPIVVKASGSAAGKGAVVCLNRDEARSALTEMMQNKIFGSAGEEVVIEEFMVGEEASIFAVTDGKYYKLLTPAQDHKAAYDGDLGPNTGGMGTYAPAPVVSSELLNQIATEIVEPTLAGMRQENRSFAGVLFVGVMVTPDGPKVIEYNCRFGDPETQVILPLFDGDLAELLYQAATGKFTVNEILPVKAAHAVCVNLVSGGYPGSYEKKLPISGLEQIDNAVVIHAGTMLNNNQLLTAGGRVLGVVTQAESLASAINKSYSEAAKIDFKGVYFRKDIGAKGLKYYNNN